MSREPVYCYTCQSNVRGTLGDHVGTRRHRSAAAPHLPRHARRYSARRSAYAHAFRMLRDREAIACEDTAQENTWRAIGRPDVGAFVAAWHGWADADPSIVAAIAAVRDGAL